MLLCGRSCILSAFKEAEPRKNTSSSSTMSSTWSRRGLLYRVKVNGRELLAAFHGPRLSCCVVLLRHTLNESNGSVIIVPSNQTQDFGVDDHRHTNHQEVVLSTVQ